MYGVPYTSMQILVLPSTSVGKRCVCGGGCVCLWAVEIITN